MPNLKKKLSNLITYASFEGLLKELTAYSIKRLAATGIRKTG
jgi:hypothetical protein